MGFVCVEFLIVALKFWSEKPTINPVIYKFLRKLAKYLMFFTIFEGDLMLYPQKTLITKARKNIHNCYVGSIRPIKTDDKRMNMKIKAVAYDLYQIK